NRLRLSVPAGEPNRKRFFAVGSVYRDNLIVVREVVQSAAANAGHEAHLLRRRQLVREALAHGVDPANFDVAVVGADTAQDWALRGEKSGQRAVELVRP